MNREHFSLQEAWAQAGDLFAMIVSLFGAPQAIAARLILLRKNRHEILAWLGPVEALVRRLLLLKALTLPAANCIAAPAQTGKLVTAFTDRAVRPLEDDPAAWRVRFAIWPYGHARKLSSAAPIEVRRGAPIAFTAHALARRLEALRRVLEHPAPALARLTRLLAARRETASVAFSPYRPPGGAAASLLESAQQELAAAFNTS